MTGLMDPMLVNNYPVDQFMRFDDIFENYIVDRDLFKPIVQENLTAFLSERKNRNIIIYRISMQEGKLDWTRELMKEYKKILERHESGKISGVRIIGSGSHSIR